MNDSGPALMQIKLRLKRDVYIEVSTGYGKPAFKLHALSHLLGLGFRPFTHGKKEMFFVEQERVTGFCAIVRRIGKDRNLYGLSFRLTGSRFVRSHVGVH